MTESIKSWVHIPPGRDHAPLSGVFVNSRFIDEAVKIIEHGGDDDEVLIVQDHDGE